MRPPPPHLVVNALKCPFGCELYFVSKAALQRHQVRLHEGRRTPKDLSADQFEDVPLFNDIEKIIRRAGNDSREFIVQYRTLPNGDRFPWNMN